MALIEPIRSGRSHATVTAAPDPNIGASAVVTFMNKRDAFMKQGLLTSDIRAGNNVRLVLRTVLQIRGKGPMLERWAQDGTNRIALEMNLLHRRERSSQQAPIRGDARSRGVCG